MSVHVLSELLVFLGVYSTTLLAFSMAFHLLVPGNPSFSDPLTAAIRVVTMMLGEFEFAENFRWDAVAEAGGSNGTSQVRSFYTHNKTYEADVQCATTRGIS